MLLKLTRSLFVLAQSALRQRLYGRKTRKLFLKNSLYPYRLCVNTTWYKIHELPLEKVLLPTKKPSV